MPSWEVIAQILTAIGVIGTLAQSWRNGRDIKVIHTATNSMKDALVAATDKAARAEGKEAGRVEGEIRADKLAEAVKAP